MDDRKKQLVEKIQKQIEEKQKILEEINETTEQLETLREVRKRVNAKGKTVKYLTGHDVIDDEMGGFSEGSFINIAGGNFCVDKDTEFLTRSGWKKINEWDNDEVCEWDLKTGNTSFQNPLNYIKEKANELISIKSKSVDMMMCENHKMPYVTTKGNMRSKTLKEAMNLSKIQIPRYFKTPNNSVGTGISKEILRVLVMQTADGSIKQRKNHISISLNFKKERKIKYARQLLNDAEIKFTEGVRVNGYTFFYYTAPKEIGFKNLSPLWKANRDEMNYIFDDLFFWDGNILHDGYGVTKRFIGNKADSEVVQYLISAVSGKSATLTKDKRDYKKEDLYTVTLNRSSTNTIAFKKNKSVNTKIEKVKTEDGFKYCFTTKSGFWLARRNGKIFPTGNCGKTTLVLKIIENIATYSRAVFFSYEMYENLLVKNKLTNTNIDDNLVIVQNKYLLMDIEIIIRAEHKKGVKFFAIDSMMKIKVLEKMQDHQKVSLISSTLSKLTQELGIIIVLINQVALTDIREKRLEFKGSGDVSYDSDVSFFITVDEEDDSRMLHCKKDRINERVWKRDITDTDYIKRVVENMQNKKKFNSFNNQPEITEYKMDESIDVDIPDIEY